MNTAFLQNNRRAKPLREWLLAVLRFCLTLDNADRLIIFAMATELDKSGSLQSDTPAFRFFNQTSAELCTAIANPAAPTSLAIIQRHLARIEDNHLKHVFAAAFRVDIAGEKHAIKSKKLNNDLWKGLSH